MAKKIIPIIIVLALIAGFIFLQKRPDEASLMGKVLKSPDGTTAPAFTDHSASFAIFTHGTFRVFTASMYHNLSSDVFIQANDPSVVHVKKEEITWDDFFKTLPFKLTKECLITGTKETFCTGTTGSLKFYLNGAKTDNLLGNVIQKGDRALITFGSEEDQQIQNQLQRVPR